MESMQDHKQYRDDKSINQLDKVFIGSQQTQHIELHNDDLDHDRELTRSKYEAHGGDDNHLATLWTRSPKQTTHTSLWRQAW
jgi:hypothetical protein